MPPRPPPTPVRRATVGRVLSAFRPHWRGTLVVAATIVVTSLLGLAQPLLVRSIIDRAIPARDTRLLGLLAGATVALTLISGAFDTLQTYATTRVGQRVMFDLRQGLYAHLQKMSVRFFGDTRSGEVLTRVQSDVAGVQETVTNTIADVLKNLVTALSTLALMAAMDRKLTLVGIAMLPLFLYPSRKAAGAGRKLSREQQERVADVNAALSETLSVSGALLSKTFGHGARDMERFRKASVALMDVEVRRAMLGQLFWVTVQAFWAASPGLIYWVGGRAVTQGALSLGSVVAFVALQNRLFFPVSRLFGVHVQVQSALGVFERIFEYLDMPVEVAEKPGARALVVSRGEVEFDGVGLEYVPGKSALRDVSFLARPGELTALVGPSGAGKTSVTYLLSRLYDATRGGVRVDGQDVRDVTLDSIGAAVGVVTQETFLLHATVKENIAYGRPDATDEEVAAAARAANIHARILELPKGYDTLVGERGYKLSGGERQRIAIARVILKNAPIVVLDEATSALDTASERLIQAALGSLTRGRTTIAIAHRLSTILRADQILVMENGRVVERGRHEELYARGGLYRRLVDAQFGPAADEGIAPGDPALAADPALPELAPASALPGVRESSLARD